MKVKIIILLAVFFGVAATTNVIKQYEHPRAKVTTLVVDESGNPISGATVTLVFGEARNANAIVKVEGLTDNEGKFTGEGYSGGSYGAKVTKDGFYLSGLNSPKLTNIVEGRWEPWNPTAETVLRLIGKPVALYARKVQAAIPVLNKPCGYDLEAGDWVMPYGKGIKKDLIFTIRNREVRDTGNFDAQGELTFANPLDGLQDTKPVVIYSVFKWERQAPENGYQPKFQLQNTWWKSLHQTPVRSFKFGGKEWEGYFFRVRTVEQNGKIVSAHYGKIRGGIEIEPRETPTCTIIFTYYFNPTPNNRNLEWDMKKNLFSGLTDLESPREP
jgi:hypothetical protein